MFTAFSIVIFFSVIQTVLSADEQFEACLPKTCGNGLSISYPFWINGTQSSTCGFPGFSLSCKNGDAIVKLSDDEYIIRDILYGNQSFVVAKDGVSGELCTPLTYSVNFDESPFAFVPASANLSIFFNCSSLVLNEYSHYSFGCSSDNARHRSLALFSDNPLLSYVNQSGQCETSVSIPVNEIGNEIFNGSMSGEIVDVLQKGFHLGWNVSKCDECAESGGRCGFDYSKFMCFCPDRPHHRRCRSITGARSVVLKSVIGISAVFFMALPFILWKCRHSSSTFKIISERQNKTQRQVEDFLKSHGSLVPKRFNYYDIKKMTSSFKDKIGQGGYGEVYKGKLLDGRLVAVKLLNDDKGTGGQEFINEVASISMTSHVNIVSLLGFCFDGSKRALIYEFMANGSLEKYIYNPSLEDQPHLGWETLYQIAIGVARGLEYLHRGCNTRILHFDIKPHNILLDIDFTPKISDFGLAKLCPRKESIISMLDTRGTAGYIAPEVFSRQFGGVSHKSDVYSYGMMVLEVIGKRKNVDVRANHTSEIYFPEWIYKRLEIGEDLGLNGIISAEEKDTARKMTLVALWCIQTNPMDRPAMTRVVEMLEGRLESLSIPPKPYLCSPPRSPQSLVISSSVT